MSFFLDGFTRDKLALMYFLNAIGIELTREQMTTGLGGFVSYFDLQTAINELEEEALIASIPRACGKTLCLTDHGRATLSMFQERLPQSTRDELDSLALNKHDKFLNDKQFTYNMEKASNGAYGVTMKILEQNGELFGVKLMYPDVQSANHAAALWESKAEALYNMVLSTFAEE